MKTHMDFSKFLASSNGTAMVPDLIGSFCKLQLPRADDAKNTLRPYHLHSTVDYKGGGKKKLNQSFFKITWMRTSWNWAGARPRCLFVGRKKREGGGEERERERERASLQGVQREGERGWWASCCQTPHVRVHSIS